jgi:Zn-dependent protease with chaperone function
MRPRAAAGAATRSSSWLRIGATALAAVAIAEAAVWLLRPKGGAVGTARVSERSYFPAERIERSRSFRSGQRVLFFAGLGVQGGVLVVLAMGRPAFARRRLEALGRRPLRGAALAGAGLSLTLAAAGLPLDAAGHGRAVDYELSTQGTGAWLADQGKSTAIGAGLAAAGAALLVGLQRRFPRRWWLAGAGAVVGIEVAFVWLAPVLLAPVFNRFEPLPAGPLRQDVLSLARRAGVAVGEVYETDASRRSRVLNAYVDGLGPTKRVVLYDNLVSELGPGPTRFVVAHELAHVRQRDIPRGMLWVAIVAPAGLLLAAGLGERLARRSGAGPGTPAALPAFALGLAVTATLLSVVSNQLSRAVEARADTFALELTNDPESAIELQRSVTLRNLSDPDPPAALRFLLSSHPPAVERIGAAIAWKKGERP